MSFHENLLAAAKNKRKLHTAVSHKLHRRWFNLRILGPSRQALIWCYMAFHNRDDPSTIRRTPHERTQDVAH